MNIRSATPADLSAILDIYNDAILTTTAVYAYTAHTPEMRRVWYDEKIKKDIPVFVAIVDGHVAGFASWGPFRAWDAYQYSVEHSVYVHRDFRQRGIARKLVEELIVATRSRKVHTLIAGIDADNAASIRLHEQLGFKLAGHIEQVGYKFGRWLDLKFYQLILDSNFKPEEKI